MELPIEYKSQWDEDASLHNGDCMETCLAMLLSYLYKADFSTWAITRIAGGNNNLTSISELKKASEALGLHLRQERGSGDVGYSERLIKAGKPHIAIVKANTLSWQEGKTYDRAHAVLVIGADSACGVDGADKVYIINDPDHSKPENKGKQIVPSYKFEEAWGGTGFLMLIPERGRLDGKEKDT